MGGAQTREGSIRTPLDAALEDEVLRIEVRIAQLWQLICLLCVGLSLVLGLRSSRPLALWGTVVALLFLGWFALHERLLVRGLGSPRLRVFATCMESVMPWAALIMLA